MAIPTLSEDAMANKAQMEQAMQRLRDAAPQLHAQAVKSLRQHIGEMMGAFMSVRRLPAQSQEIVAHFIGVMEGQFTADETRARLRVWARQGLEPVGAYDVMDTLYRAGVELGGPALMPQLEMYRRQFTIGYDLARREEILAEHERLQRGMFTTLEKQVISEREARAALQRRQKQLGLSAELARAGAATRDLNQFMQYAAQQLQTGFALDFVGIYLLDEFRQWAILRAGAGQVGSELTQRGYHLALDPGSVLTRVSVANEPCLLVEGKIGDESFTPPILPATRLIAIAPLVARGETRGFWTAHSDRLDAFGQQDIPTLTLIADNLASAVENAELINRATVSLEELERTQREYIHQAWTNRDQVAQVVYSQDSDTFVTEPLAPPSNGDAAPRPESVASLTVPIALRGEVIGTVDLMDTTRTREWSQDERALATSVVEQMALAVENARLFEQAEQRAQEFSALNEIANTISQELTLERLFENVRTQVAQVMPTDAFYVTLYDATNNAVSYPYIFDDGVTHAPRPVAPTLRGNLLRVIETGNSIIVNRTPAEIAQALAQLNVNTAIGNVNKASASLLYVPMRRGEQIIGALSTQSYSSNAYTERHIALLEGIASHVAIALKNAQLFQETEAAANRFATLNRVARAVTSPGDFDEMARGVYQEIDALLKPDAFLMALYNAADNIVDFRLSVDRGVEYPPEQSPLAGTLSSQVIVSGAPVLIADLRQSELSNQGVNFGSVDEVRTWLGVPLRSGENTFGVLSIQSYSPDCYGQVELQLLQTIADQIGVAVERARLFDETKQRVAEVQSINELAGAISGELESAKLFRIVYEYLPRLLPSDAFIVWIYDAATNTVTRPVLYDKGESFSDEGAPRPPSGKVARVIELNEPVALNLTRAEWEQEKARTEAIVGTETPSASLLFVPLAAGDQVKGVMSVQAYEFDAYHATQVALLTSVASHVVAAMDNARLFGATQAALAETQLLYETGSHLNQVNTLEELAHIVAKPAFDRGAGSAQLLLLETASDGTLVANVVVSWTAIHGLAPLPQHTRFPLNEFSVGKYFMANPGAMLFVEDIETNPVIDAQTRAILTASNTRAAAFLPLVVEQRNLGLVLIGWPQKYSFTAGEQRIYQSLSSQLALVLNNRLLFQQTQDSLAETQMLYQTGAQLNMAATLPEALRAASAVGIEDGADTATLMLIESSANNIPKWGVVAARWSNRTMPSGIEGTRYDLDTVPLSKIWIENPDEPLLVADIESDARVDENARSLYRYSHVRATALLPLRVGARWVALQILSWPEPHSFSERDERLYRAIMSQAATVLDNRQLFEQTEQALAEARTLYEISARLNAANSIQEALEAASGPAVVQGATRAGLMRIHTDSFGNPQELELLGNWPREQTFTETMPTRFPLSFFAGTTTWLANASEPAVFSDLRQVADLAPEARALVAHGGTVASAALPLKVGERWIGLLTFSWDQPHEFTARDLRLYRAIMAQAATVLDNRALFEQTQVALRQTQDALTQVQETQARLNLQFQTARLLAGANRFDDVATELLETICHAQHWQLGEYWAADEAAQILTLRHVWGAALPEVQPFIQDTIGLKLSYGKGFAGAAWEERRPIWAENILTDARFHQTQAAHAAGLVSAFAFPTLAAQVTGVAVFFSVQSQSLDEHTFATMTGVGNQITQYLQRRQAEEAVRQQNAFLNALHDTTLGLMRRLDLEELLQNIITRAAELVGTEHGYVHLIEPNAKELRMRVGIGLYRDLIGTRAHSGQGLAGTVWQNAEAIVVDDYQHWPGRLPQVDRDALRAVIGVPLKSEAQTVGVLGLASLDEGRVFTPAEVEAVERFAELAAVALDNAQLYESTQTVLRQTQRAAERDKTIAEITDRLYAAADIKSALQTAAEELQRTTGSKRAVVRLNLQTSKTNGKE